MDCDLDYFGKSQASSNGKLKYRILANVKPNLLKTFNKVWMFDTDNGVNVLAISQDDQVYAMGSNTFGLLGLGHKREVKCPTLVEELCNKHIITFTAGFDFMVCLTDQGEVYTWGKAHKGRLGDGINDNRVHGPKLIVKAPDDPEKSVHKVIDIKCTYCSTYMLSDHGDFYWFGYKGYNSTEQLVPALVVKDDSIGQFVAIGCGVDHTVALTAAGKVYSWGRNDMMQLGLGHSRHTDQIAMVELPNDIRIQSLAVGSNHCLLLTSDGQLCAFGANDCGQLGIGSHDNQSVPQLVVNRTKFVEIVANDQRSLAMSDKGFVYVWGQTRRSNLTRPERTDFNEFQEVINTYFKTTFAYQPLSQQSLYEPGNRVYRIISTAFNNQRYSDLKIKVQGELIYVHKWFIVENCRHFQTMFSNECWQENETNIIEVAQHTYLGYFEFLKFLYTNQFTSEMPDVLIDVLHITDEYLESDIKLVLCQYIRTLINSNNVCDYYAASIKYSAPQLEVYCFENMCLSIYHIIETDGFKRMPDMFAKHLLKDYIKYLHEYNSKVNL